MPRRCGSLISRCTQGRAWRWWRCRRIHNSHPAVQWDELGPHNKQVILDAVVERELLAARQHELGILPEESNIPPPPEELVNKENMHARKHPAAWWSTRQQRGLYATMRPPPLLPPIGVPRLHLVGIEDKSTGQVFR